MVTRLIAIGGVLLFVLLSLYFILGAPKVMALPNTPLNLDFTCTQEVWPTSTPEAEQFFSAARTLERERNKANYPEIARLYREAIALNHPNAMLNFQFLLNKGVVEPQKGLSALQEMIALNERLIAMNIPSAFYFMGYYVENGIGVKRDFIDTMRFYRKAADLGNAEAQYLIGDFFISSDTS